MMSKQSLKHKLPKQGGVVLLTGMIFLVILTIIVVAVMRNATIEERMASNTRNRQLALQAAEAVLRDAESTLFAAAPFSPFDPTAFTTACTNGLCSKPSSGVYRWSSGDVDWSNTGVTRTLSTTAANLVGLNAQPRYFVELMGYEGGQAQMICPKILYRISVRGEGMNSSLVFIQSVYRHRPAKFLDGSCG